MCVAGALRRFPSVMFPKVRPYRRAGYVQPATFVDDARHQRSRDRWQLFGRDGDLSWQKPETASFDLGVP